MPKGLLDWASEQAAWVQDSLRRIALAVDHSVGDEDFADILENVRTAVGAGTSELELIPLNAAHLGSGTGETRRTVLAQLGPVQNIDRLAGGQKLRMAPDGITLIYGENGSGKERSGHDMSAGRDIPQPMPDEMEADIKALDDFRLAHKKGQKAVSARRSALEEPLPATLI